ncbi:RNA-guided endonuclease InsQ/TnpB family protein [Paractinoplanes rishiriensis]|uniref:Cas12f1-like TNB domain-containing protein n=1 Tax=Paractinoplanes rishiriensis TaxID=1050105 RepID=A0A919K9D4_9ACTN|nr:zinc ribbon domain-containing protein [Actinoplanes rishiriensis]GIE98996.1 hypothetical protein Ari01nite_64610 [Actinoplanes rishiriensis]
MRTAYKCRAYPTPAQAATSYKQTDAALTAWKQTVELAFLSEVSSVPLQRTLRHQHASFATFFAGRARYPRFKSRTGRQSASVENFAVLSTGQRIVNPRHLERQARNLARYQRRLAQASSDCGWGEFRRQLEYKAEHAGRTLVVVDRWLPSSKTCSACGHLLAAVSLGTSHWTCPGCGTRHDRDHNAAKNIIAAGRAVARTPGNACGADVRRQGPALSQSAVKQEPQPAKVGIPRL